MMKIVSLLPSATELACALGLSEYLVAISHECDFPASVGSLPRITGSIIPHGLSQAEIDDLVSQALKAGKSLYTVDGELLRDLEPDLILTQGLCDVCAVMPETVEASLRGVSCQLSSQTRLISFEATSFEGICADLITLGQATQRMEQAQNCIAMANEKWNAFSFPKNPKRVLLLEWVDPLFSAGHWVPQQIEMAGLRSAIGLPQDHSRRLSWEEVRLSEPDAIGVICCGFGLDENLNFARTLINNESLMSMKAIQERAVWAFDANAYFSRPTLRIVDGAECIHAAFVKEESRGEGFCRV